MPAVKDVLPLPQTMPMAASSGCRSASPMDTGSPVSREYCGSPAEASRSRYVLVRIALSVTFAACVPLAHGDDYPSKPVRFIVAFPPGGNADLMGRLAAQKLTEGLGQTFVVDNRGGAGGMIAEELAVRAVPDGYTLLMVSLAHTVLPAMNKKLSYDSARDLVPVSELVSVPNVLVVHRSVNAQSVPELIELANARPGQLTYAASHGTTLHLAGELFKLMSGTDIVNVSYKSGGLAVPDLEAGRVHMSFSVMTTALNMLKNGRVRALAVTSAKRSSVLPDVPAIAEFLPGYQITGWQGVLAPAGTPPPIIAKVSAELGRAMRSRDVRARLTSIGADPIGSTPQEFAAFREAEFARMKTLVEKTGIKFGG
jgi:tripartite-type tricarboxylate transporter receptor subunit TctC